MILLIANQKGGVGKSTIACNAAVALAHKARDVLLLDADRQTSANEWWVERKLNYPNLPKIHCMHKYGWIDETLEDLSTRYEYILVDCAGRESEEMRSAMAVEGVVMLMPFKPSAVDLATLQNMSVLIHESRKRVNRSLLAYAFLSIAPTNSQVKEIEQAREAISQYPEMSLLDTVIYDRKVYRDAMALGLGVLEMEGKGDSERKSRAEITALVEEVVHNV